MQYYSSKGEIKEINLGISEKFGGSSEIHKLRDNIYFKNYFDNTKPEYRINYELYIFLKKLNHPFTNQIVELYYEKTKHTSRENLTENIKKIMPDAYEYIYIEEEKKNILNEPIEYFLYNLKELENLMEIFVEYNIIVRDLKKANSVFYGDKIILIDLDSCRFQKDLSKEYIRNTNRMELIELFINIIKLTDNYSRDYDCILLSDLFYCSEEETLTTSASRRLARYKNLIEYLKD